MAGVTTSHSAMPRPRNAAVYLLASARPPNTPAASHQRGDPAMGVPTRANAQMVAVQNSSSGESGVMMTDPTPRISVALNNAPAAIPARLSAIKRFAASASSSVPRAATIGPNRRTPSAVSPASADPIAIHSATMGGWSKYPGAGACAQIQ